MPTLPLHISHSTAVSEGGIAIAVAELVTAQQIFGLDPAWLTADRFRPWQRDRELRRAVDSQAPQLVHIHGLWRSSTRIAAALSSDGFPLVIAPHGMLDAGALAISRRKKQLVWHLWERRAMQCARCLHALCKAEASAMRDLLPSTPIALIPNGVAVPDQSALEPNALSAPCWAETIPAGEPVLLFLGRFHHKKGLDPLLEAWHAVAAEAARAGWWLALVGYGDDGQLDQQLRASPVPRAVACGPVFGAAKQAVLAAASAFILPSHSEGLPMAALEAMAHQLPCLLSSACNLPEAFRAGAALPAEPEPAALAASLRQLFALRSSDRAAMGSVGQALVRERFSWPVVADQTRELYRWILDGGERPSFVELP